MKFFKKQNKNATDILTELGRAIGKEMSSTSRILIKQGMSREDIQQVLICFQYNSLIGSVIATVGENMSKAEIRAHIISSLDDVLTDMNISEMVHAIRKETDLVLNNYKEKK